MARRRGSKFAGDDQGAGISSHLVNTGNNCAFVTSVMHFLTCMAFHRAEPPWRLRAKVQLIGRK